MPRSIVDIHDIPRFESLLRIIVFLTLLKETFSRNKKDIITHTHTHRKTDRERERKRERERERESRGGGETERQTKSKGVWHGSQLTKEQDHDQHQEDIDNVQILAMNGQKSEEVTSFKYIA